ncbi:hypothetical protein [Aurantimonas sp. 22II-16-19i]|uniref:hypothetical protein n=1 Tax=Aurantimonas sp. 22II-16-19i TaxID=1317114 RepID=UPI001FD8DB8C|nr:hypothetical protein [Aurantimonas sp. 22II-16-19i]
MAAMSCPVWQPAITTIPQSSAAIAPAPFLAGACEASGRRAAVEERSVIGMSVMMCPAVAKEILSLSRTSGRILKSLQPRQVETTAATGSSGQPALPPARGGARKLCGRRREIVAATPKLDAKSMRDGRGSRRRGLSTRGRVDWLPGQREAAAMVRAEE